MNLDDTTIERSMRPHSGERLADPYHRNLCSGKLPQILFAKLCRPLLLEFLPTQGALCAACW